MQTSAGLNGAAEVATGNWFAKSLRVACMRTYYVRVFVFCFYVTMYNVSPMCFLSCCSVEDSSIGARLLHYSVSGNGVVSQYTISIFFKFIYIVFVY